MIPICKNEESKFTHNLELYISYRIENIKSYLWNKWKHTDAE